MTKINRILLLAAMLALPVIMMAQSPSNQTIYLKNGSVIKGTIIEEIPNKSYTVQTADQSTFVFAIEDVEKIVWFSPTPSQGLFRFKPEITPGIKEVSPYQLSFDLIFGTPINNDDYQYYDNLSGLNATFLYQMTSNFSIGVGTGIEGYDGLNWIPVFMEFRSEVQHGITTPFLYGRIGYNNPSMHSNYRNYNGGIMAGLGVGAKTKISQSTTLSLNIGYRYQALGYEEYVYYAEVRGDDINVTGGEPNGTEPPSPEPGIMPPYWYPPYKVNTGVHFLTLGIGLNF